MVDVPEEFMENPELIKAMELAQESSYTPAELEAYDKYWDAVRVEKTLTIDAFQAGKTEGKTEGIAEGIAEGIEIGEAKGRDAEKIIMVKGMLKAGIAVDVIAKVSGLAKDQIEKL
jgi:predicted transposase/invertase (TIGR01784 family)